jgi:hypothetical protein
MANGRVKGHTFERQMAKLFRDMGWEKCVTSRLESKAKDDAGIDLCNTDPFSVQCKAVEKLGSLHDVLAKMPQDTNYNIVLHKRNRSGVIVAMTLEDFQEIVEKLKANKIL